MSEWKTIETAPKDGTSILMCCKPDSPGSIGWKFGIGCWSGKILWDWPWLYRPTHWMPLPPPPATVGPSTSGETQTPSQSK